MNMISTIGSPSGATPTTPCVTRLGSSSDLKTIAPLISGTISKGTVVYTDEYDIYDRLTEWGYPHHTVCHSAGEFARDEDGDGFCEIHVNTIEGFWSLLRSWLRPHRGVSKRN